MLYRCLFDTLLDHSVTGREFLFKGYLVTVLDSFLWEKGPGRWDAIFYLSGARATGVVSIRDNALHTEQVNVSRGAVSDAEIEAYWEGVQYGDEA